MGRPADKPTPFWSDEHGCWCVRVTKAKPPGWTAKQSPREFVRLIPKRQPPIAKKDRARAEMFAALVVKGIQSGAGAPDDDGETVEVYARRWLKARTGRVSSILDNKTHLEMHILPVIGRHVMALVTAKEIEEVVASLDRRVRAGELSSKTTKNIWGTCSKMFDDATHAKPGEGLRCLEKDPTDGVRGPDDDDPDKVLQFLYPSEFMTFISCEAVPFGWRRSVAIAVYLCLRDGEHRALKWSAVDLEHGVVTVCETFNRRKGEDREGTKGGAARVVPIRPELQPLLEAMKKESGGEGLVCDLASLRDMARGLRRWLWNANVRREQLHTGTTVSKRLRWHDMRATGLTWLAVEGKPATEIRDIAGHTQTSMTDRYMRAAGVLRGGRFGNVFPTLPTSLIDGTGAECSEASTSASKPEQPTDDDPAVSPGILLESDDNSEHFFSASSPVRPAILSEPQ